MISQGWLIVRILSYLILSYNSRPFFYLFFFFFDFDFDFLLLH